MSDKMKIISHYFLALRPHQWLKNFLIFIPLLTAHQIDKTTIFFAQFKDNNLRLDKFLTNKLISFTRSQIKKIIDSKFPLGRPGNAKDVANLINFLCSDDASYINGSNIVIDGGESKLSFEI